VAEHLFSLRNWGHQPLGGRILLNYFSEQSSLPIWQFCPPEPGVASPGKS
jgi:hypothetical protein